MQTAAANQATDRVGVCNRVFKYVYQIRLVGKALKRRNRTVYYAVKYALFGGILALIFI